jgi:hypothetical protein
MIESQKEARMPDEREFKIKITTQSDSGGAKRAAESMGDLSKETEHAEISHKALRTILRQLGPEFAELGHLGVVGFANPVTAGALGLALAFAGIQKYLESSTEAMKEFGAADPRSLDPVHINAAKEAWREYAEELRAAGENMNSVEKATDRYIKRIEAELGRRKERIGSTKELEDARAGIGAPDQQGKLLSGMAADRQRRQAEADAEQAKVEAKKKEAIDLYSEALDKKGQASGIHVATAKQDADTLAEFNKTAEQDRKTVENFKERSILGLIAKSMKGIFTGESPGDIMAREETEAMQAEARLGRAANLGSRMPDREQMRKRRTDLYKGAAEDETKAVEIASIQVPEMQSEADANRTHSAAMGLQNNLKLAYQAVEEGNRQSKALSEKIAEGIEGHNQVPQNMLKALEKQNQFNEQIKTWVQELERQVANLRN